jgi:hypothetical protein
MTMAVLFQLVLVINISKPLAALDTFAAIDCSVGHLPELNIVNATYLLVTLRYLDLLNTVFSFCTKG